MFAVIYFGQTPVPVDRRTTNRVATMYSQMAKRLGITGTVELEIVVR